MTKFTSSNKDMHPIYIICDGIRSLLNVGIIFRLSDALAVKKLYLCGITGHPKIEEDDRRYEVIERAERQIKKTALSTFDTVDWEYCPSSIDVVKKLKSEGVQIVSLQQTPKSINYLNTDYNYPLAIVLGYEITGVSQEVLKLSDLVVEIPMYGTIDSLNVATSLAVLGYKIREK